MNNFAMKGDGGAGMGGMHATVNTYQGSQMQMQGGNYTHRNNLIHNQNNNNKNNNQFYYKDQQNNNLLPIESQKITARDQNFHNTFNKDTNEETNTISEFNKNNINP